MNHTLTDILNAVSTLRIPSFPGEYDLHAEIAAALTAAGISYRHEASIAPRCRIDFLVGSIGIEVKKSRPVPSELKKQLTRYLASSAVSAIIVVTQRGVLLPNTIAGKPVYLVTLNRLWGVALP